MRIAQIVPSLLRTGPVNVALDLTCFLREAGHEVKVFYLDEKAGAPHFEGAEKWKPGHFKLWKNFDILHSHGLRPDIWVSLAGKNHPPALSTMHNYVKEDLKGHYPSLLANAAVAVWNRACLSHRAIVVLSNNMKSYYRSFWKNQNLAVIPNTRRLEGEVDEDIKSAVLKFAANRQVIGCVSAVHPRKGLHQIVEFLARNPDWCYVHVGGGALDQMQKLAQSKKVAKRCWFTGAQPQGWQYISAFNLFCLPSYSEGFPLSLIEAAQLEVPILTSDLPVFRELFPESVVARHKFDNVESFNAAVNAVMQNPEERAQITKTIFEEKYSPEVVLKKTLELYRSVQQ